MRALLQIGREAIGAYEGILAFPGVTGLTVETDALLREMWRIRTRLGNREWERVDQSLAEWSRHLRAVRFRRGFDSAKPLRDVIDGLGLDLSDDYRGVPVDPHWSCRAFATSLSARNDEQVSEPGLIFTVLYDPAIGSNAFNELAGTASEIAYRTRFSPRPVASALSGGKQSYSPLLGGISIGEEGRNASGTLGGCVDIDGIRYGVTCGHVIATAKNVVQPSHPDGGSTIGACAHSTEGTLTPTGDGCRARGAANSTDAALLRFDDVEMDAKVRKQGDISDVVPLDDVVEGETVVVSARSGQKTLQIGALALRRSVSIGGSDYCFQDLFELRRTGTSWGVKGSVSPPTKAGDSGAWVLRPEPDGRFGWLGMVTAGDGPCSYAQFSETVSDWANDAVSTMPATASTPWDQLSV